MKKLIIITLIIACLFALTGCGFSRNCNHAYYRSDYQAPSTGINGYSVYTCRNCGDSYRETEPAFSGSVSSQNSASEKEDNNSGYSKNSRSIKLFDLPLYSKDTGYIDTVDYVTERLDTNGYRHKNCYMLCTSESGSKYVRYDLGAKYSTISGNLYQLEGNTGTMWLEFYDGDEFLFSTGRLSDNQKNVSFEFDISGVNYLTVYPMTSSFYNSSWIIADQITITK